MSNTRETYLVTIDENGAETVFKASPIWADRIAAEKHLREHKLGKLEDNAFTAITVMTFAALKRNGSLPSVTTYDTYESLIVGIELEEAEEAPKS